MHLRSIASQDGIVQNQQHLLAAELLQQQNLYQTAHQQTDLASYGRKKIIITTPLLWRAEGAEPLGYGPSAGGQQQAQHQGNPTALHPAVQAAGQWLQPTQNLPGQRPTKRPSYPKHFCSPGDKKDFHFFAPPGEFFIKIHHPPKRNF
ncbi:MAG: hypothetical protein NZ602_03480 [Thermoguttaceae bacterium]|nr:hypothetical protein [Thermoguttaceae bacterium]